MKGEGNEKSNAHNSYGTSYGTVSLQPHIDGVN